LDLDHSYFFRPALVRHSRCMLSLVKYFKVIACETRPMQTMFGPGISCFEFRICQKLINSINLAFQGVTSLNDVALDTARKRERHRKKRQVHGSIRSCTGGVNYQGFFFGCLIGASISLALRSLMFVENRGQPTQIQTGQEFHLACLCCAQHGTQE